MDDAPDPVHFRQASDHDVEPLCGLLEVLFEQEADFTPDRERQARGLRMIIGNPGTGLVLCAFAGETMVGMATLLFTVSTAEGGRAAWLEDMVVHPAARGRGIGERILHEAIAAAREAGCLRITLLTDDGNEPAMRFYSRADFVRSRMVPFRLKL